MPISEMLRQNVALAAYTTLHLGGPARYFAACRDLDQIKEGLIWAESKGLPVQILGGGSNTVFPDRGFPGLVMYMDLRGLDFRDDRVAASAGEDWDALVLASVEKGLSGLECLSGIPGQVGATPIQNVGAYGSEVKDSIVSVRALDRRTLEVEDIPGKDCGFTYRGSRFKSRDRDRYIILGVTFRLAPDARPVIRYPELARRIESSGRKEAVGTGTPALKAVREVVLDLRRAKSMVYDLEDPDAHSVGSFFLNPVLDENQVAALQERLDRPSALPRYTTPEGVKVSAAWLVEQAGFTRGYRQGGVGVSSKHALALVNYGGATTELLALAEKIQREVWRRFQVKLHPEPVIVDF